MIKLQQRLSTTCLRENTPVDDRKLPPVWQVVCSRVKPPRDASHANARPCLQGWADCSSDLATDFSELEWCLDDSARC